MGGQSQRSEELVVKTENSIYHIIDSRVVAVYGASGAAAMAGQQMIGAQLKGALSYSAARRGNEFRLRPVVGSRMWLELAGGWYLSTLVTAIHLGIHVELLGAAPRRRRRKMITATV